MAKTYAAGLLSAIAAATAAASLNQNNAYADGILPPNPSEIEPSPAPPPPKVRNDHPRTTSAGFDPEALERGVKALREISKSPHGKKVSALCPLSHSIQPHSLFLFLFCVVVFFFFNLVLIV